MSWMERMTGDFAGTYRKRLENYQKGFGGLNDAQIVTGHKKTGLFGWGKGKDVYSGILDVYPELIKANGELDTEMLQVILDTRKMSDETRNYLENLIDLKDAMDEAEQALEDLALIKIEGDDFPTIPVGNSDALKVGEWVLAVGNPFNLNSTVTAGIVSAKARSIGGGAANGQAANIQSFIQTDAAINSGNSGGALVNAKGELVGINAMLYSPTGAYSGYGFAIPTSIMTKVIADLKQYGTVQRALLGVVCTDLNMGLAVDEENKVIKEIKEKAKELGIKEGIWVREVTEGGSSAGILKENDVIIAIDGRKIHRFADLQEELAKHRPGDKINVTVLREKKEKTVEITLKNEQGTTKVVKDAGMEILGAAFKPVSSELKKQLNLGYGLEVTGVTNGKMADAGIRKGFIILKANGQPMRTVEDLEKAMKEARKSPEQGLFITGMFPSGKRAMYAVDLTQE